MVRVHPTAQVSPEASIGEGTRIWRGVQIREGARIGTGCNIGQNAYIDHGVIIGNNVKIHNNASLYHGLEIEDGVFVGGHAIFTNDRLPRSINPDGSPKALADWTCGRILVRYGAAVGAGSVVVTGVTIGRWAMIGAGSVVTRDVPDHGLAVGNPGRLIGFVSARGARCTSQDDAMALTRAECDGFAGASPDN